MTDHAYLAELQGVRGRTYASLPNGLQMMASLDAEAAERRKARASAAAPSKRNTLPSLSAAEAVLDAYKAARANALSGAGYKPGMATAIMRKQLGLPAH